MADRPILFSAPMVRALIAGAKTQTRRILKPQPNGHIWRYGWEKDAGATFSAGDELVSGRIPIWAGDRLWVRETWAPLTYLTHNDPGPQAIIDGGFYRADEGTVDGEVSKWKPSIFMPRHASRLTLTVTDVQVERLNEISRDDAVAEGLSRKTCASSLAKEMGCDWGFDGDDRHGSPVSAYAALWDHINGLGAWSANPWVVAYTFTVHLGNIDQIGRIAA